MTTSTHSHKAWTDKGGHVRTTTSRLEGEEVVMSWLSLRVQLWLQELKPMVEVVWLFWTAPIVNL